MDEVRDYVPDLPEPVLFNVVGFERDLWVEEGLVSEWYAPIYNDGYERSGTPNPAAWAPDPRREPSPRGALDQSPGRPGQYYFPPMLGQAMMAIHTSAQIPVPVPTSRTLWI